MQTPTLFEAQPSAAATPATGPLRLRPLAAALRLPPSVVPPRHRRTLLAVDGNSLVHRAFHAYGEDALYGVAALLAGVAHKVSFAAILVGFDDPVHSWRRQRWEGYKAQRPAKPPALSALLARVPEVLQDLGLAVVTARGHEADDILGSAAAAAARRGWCSVLATSDRDAYSLISDDTTVLRLRSGLDNAVVMTPRTVRFSVGVEPDQYVFFAALCGDTSDNLPGIPGIGRRRARALLRAFPTLEAAAADEIGCLSVLGRDAGRALLEDMGSDDSVVRRNIELMTITRDIDIDLERCVPGLASDEIERRCVAQGLAPVAGRMAASFGARPEATPLPSEPL